MVLKIVFSVLMIGLAVMVNLALFEVVPPKMLFGYSLGGLCSFIVFIVWS